MTIFGFRARFFRSLASKNSKIRERLPEKVSGSVMARASMLSGVMTSLQSTETRCERPHFARFVSKSFTVHTDEYRCSRTRTACAALISAPTVRKLRFLGGF